jgi:hypothetical protein
MKIAVMQVLNVQQFLQKETIGANNSLKIWQHFLPSLKSCKDDGSDAAASIKAH